MLNNHLYKLLICFLISGIMSGCQTVPKNTAIDDQPLSTKSEPGQQSITTEQSDTQQTLYDQAIKSTSDGKIDDAIAQFSQLIKNNPSTAKAHTNLGLLYLHKKQNNAAKEAFENALKQDNNDAVAYNHLAVIQRQQGEFKLALFNYYKAINAKPDYANAHLNLGILLDIYLQDLPKALEQYKIFQKLTDNKNEQVKKWIIDISRRIESGKGK